eukprot:272854-Chlamydomonas_euryale.AAC.8
MLTLTTRDAMLVTSRVCDRPGFRLCQGFGPGAVHTIADVLKPQSMWCGRRASATEATFTALALRTCRRGHFCKAAFPVRS